VPRDALTRLAQDRELSAELRKSFFDTAQISHELRQLRTQAAKLSSVALQDFGGFAELAASPTVAVYDCKHTQSLPGTPVSNPGNSSDPTAKRVLNETTNVAKFYKQLFKRNSLDNQGMTILSSIHFGVKFYNAMWNGSQMIYGFGNGPGAFIGDFSSANDVIGHELTHGVTQYSLQLSYENDAGGLNESISDCFGSMFRQWEAGQDVKSADWLIGYDIMGPTAKARVSPVCATWPTPPRRIALRRSRPNIRR
jgi:Zn-dependent metalloprotease